MRKTLWAVIISAIVLLGSAHLALSAETTSVKEAPSTTAVGQTADQPAAKPKPAARVQAKKSTSNKPRTNKPRTAAKKSH